MKNHKFFPPKKVYSCGGKSKAPVKFCELKRSPKKYKNPKPPQKSPTKRATVGMLLFSKKSRPKLYISKMKTEDKTTAGITRAVFKDAPRLIKTDERNSTKKGYVVIVPAC